MTSTIKNFTVYNSSAGSGKTFTLVKEYLKIALKTENPHLYKGILAITFTNKAASEMKERIISALQALSGQKKLENTPKHLLFELLKPIKDGGLGLSEAEIKERSANVLKSILHNYNDFAISTIDKFTTKIIRTFALDLNLPLNFSIELNENEVVKNAVDLLVSEVGIDEKITNLLVNYSNQKASDEKSWNIENDLAKFTLQIIKDDGEQYLEKIRQLTLDDFEKIKTALQISVSNFRKQTKEIAKHALDFIHSNGIEAESFSSGYYYKYLQALQELKYPKPNNTLLSIIAGEKDWYSKATNTAQKSLIDSHQQELINLFSDSQNFLDENYGNYILKSELLKTIYQTAIINEIEKTIQTFKQENNILNLSDFNKQIAKIILTESIPFIYERLGEKYNHYLIDEFQDTSIIQWQNLIPLIENSLGQGNYNMLVGDAKQAIYRFRGGEVEQIINLPTIHNINNNPLLLERQATLERNFNIKNLTNNFRSKAEIVIFNNQFFDFISSRLSENFQPIYKNLNQGFDEKNVGGGVSLMLLENDDYEENTLLKIQSCIGQNIADGYQLKDIAIITKSNDKASRIASFLIGQGIQVISSESLLLNNSAEVKFVLCLLNYIINPKDASNHLFIINYLIKKNYPTEENIDWFSDKKTNYLLPFLTHHKLLFNSNIDNALSLYELAEYLIHHFNLADNTSIFLQFFLDKVHEYATKNDNSIVNFLEWWKTKSDKFSVVIPHGINAVQIMTIHKSKGLEFPIVIYPFADNRNTPNDKFIWTEQPIEKGLDASIIGLNKALEETCLKALYTHENDKSLLDDINVLYVALTRPKDRLYILSNLKNNAGKDDEKIDNLFYLFSKIHPEAKQSEMEFHFGSFVAQTNITTKHENNINEVIKKISYQPWHNKIAISYQAPKYWDVENPEKSTDFGNLIHQLLAEIDTIDEVKSVFNTFINRGIIAAHEKENIMTQLTETLEKPEVKNLFVDFEKIKNETSILLPTGESYKPDRVIFKKKQTIIVDYKSGERKDMHINQLQNYKKLLSSMGYANIEGYLLYLKEKELVKI